MYHFPGILFGAVTKRDAHWSMHGPFMVDCGCGEDGYEVDLGFVRKMYTGWHMQGFSNKDIFCCKDISKFLGTRTSRVNSPQCYKQAPW